MYISEINNEQTFSYDSYGKVDLAAVLLENEADELNNQVGKGIY